MKIKTGDTVKILSGKDRGKTGKVIQVLHKNVETPLVVVEGMRLLKKHIRPGRGQKGQILELPAPMPIGKVMLIDPSSKKPTRVGYRFEGSEKRRVAKRSDTIL